VELNFAKTSLTVSSTSSLNNKFIFHIAYFRLLVESTIAIHFDPIWIVPVVKLATYMEFVGWTK
jgi:hypothetical protein